MGVSNDWERQIPGAVRRWHEEWGRPHLDAVERDLRDVRLDGEFPNTELVAEFWDGARGRVETMRFPLWGEDFALPDGSRQPPDGVALIIGINLMDPAFPLEDR